VTYFCLLTYVYACADGPSNYLRQMSRPIRSSLDDFFYLPAVEPTGCESDDGADVASKYDGYTGTDSY